MAVSAGTKTHDFGKLISRSRSTICIKFRKSTKFRIWLSGKIIRLLKYVSPLQIRVIERDEDTS